MELRGICYWAVSRLVECVMNISEGRDLTLISRLADLAGRVQGCRLLDLHSDPDHHRSVLTLAGEPESVLATALALTAAAVEGIDLRLHRGVHPRTGAIDVIPFVPLKGVSLDECIELAHRCGREIAARHDLPVYFYGAAAARKDRRELAAIRRGQFEGLREDVMVNPDRTPDLGPGKLHPSAGAVAIGVRGFLIAFNVMLSTADTVPGQHIARAIRESSGGLPGVKALSFLLPSRGRVQISMNLTDTSKTSLYRVLEFLREEVKRWGIELIDYELVGLAPRSAICTAAAAIPDLKQHVLEERILQEIGQRIDL